MDLQLTGQRAFVTGSTGDLGGAMARLLAAEGARVVVHGRRHDAADQLAAQIRDSGGDARPVVGDLTQNVSAREVAEAAWSQFGGLDIVVNNAGAGDEVTMAWFQAAPEDWENMFQSNCLSAIRMCHWLAPKLKTQGSGRIIQISTGPASFPWPVGPHYAAAKAGVVNATVSLAKALGGTGVTVNTVTPGPIDTPSLRRVLGLMAKERGWGDRWEDIERLAMTHMFPLPSARLGMPDEVARVVAFVASPLSGFINGANYRVDGGATPHVT